jgi:hypothetical protein
MFDPEYSRVNESLKMDKPTRSVARPIASRTCVSVLLGVCALIFSISCSAHHSGALWDRAKRLTLQGTVREFQWTNPHCFIQLLVSAGGAANSSAPPQEWSIEMASPYQVLAGGWKPRTLRAGDKIEVTVNPARDGSHSGSFISGVGKGGNILGPGIAAP